MDVKTLHTNIPNSKGTASVKQKHNNYIKRTVVTKGITTFLVLILTLHNFIFNSKFHLQIKGCAMEKIFAPT